MPRVDSIRQVGAGGICLTGVGSGGRTSELRDVAEALQRGPEDIKVVLDLGA